jgi:hypothetical protein
MPIAERPDDLLHGLPRRDARPDLGLQCLGDVDGVGPPGGTPEAQGEMRAMLRPVDTVAPGSPTAAVRLGQGAEHDAGGQLVKPLKEGGPRWAPRRHRWHQ